MSQCLLTPIGTVVRMVKKLHLCYSAIFFWIVSGSIYRGRNAGVGQLLEGIPFGLWETDVSL